MAGWAELVCGPAYQRAEAMASHAFVAYMGWLLGAPSSFGGGLGISAGYVRNTRNANNARTSRTHNMEGRNSHTHTRENMMGGATAEVTRLRVCLSVGASS